MNRGRGWIVWGAALSPTFGGFVYAAVELRVSVFWFIATPLFSLVSDAVIAQERARRLRQD